METLRTVRKRAGFTQTQLAAQVGMSYPLFNMAESRGLRLNPTVARKIATVLGVDPMQIVELRTAIEVEQRQGGG